MKTTLYIKALFLTLGLMTTATTWGATAAFTGKVTAVKKAEAKKKDTLVHFTVEIDYFDYLSRGGGRLSKVGHTSDQRVLKLGSVCVINGRMVNAATFAKAIRPDLWGYFYETTWLDLQTTPNFQWGEVIAVAKDAFTLRVHRTHKEIHLEANPPVEIKVPFDDKVSFRMESEPSDAATALKPGNWVQIHEPRPQMIALWNRDTTYDPVELQPVEQGKRGLANDLTCRAVLGKVVTKTPDKVLDLSAQVACDRWLKGKKETVTLNAKKTSFILDGKLAPPKIAAVAGREAVLCHYRSDKVPHKILVRSNDDSIRGMIVAMNSQTMRLASSAGSHQIDIEKDALFQVDGMPTYLQAVIKKGGELMVYPKRGRTIIAFAPVDLK
ncbi:MAG: hypothetical protein VX757_07615 [Planctomycetota bacterium]|nr:hypothetical protein [Planctomycetota bacterium]